MAVFNARFSNYGVNLTHDPITLPVGKFTQVTNAISLYEGNLRSRFGQTKGHTTQITGTPSVYGMRRLNNSVAGTSSFLIRAGTTLWNSSGTTIPFTIASAVTGFSSAFGSIVIYRPSISAVPYAYIFDATKMAKYNGTNTYPIGYPPPNSDGAPDFSAAVGSAGGNLTPSSAYYYRFSVRCSTTGAESHYNIIPDGAILTDITASTSASNFKITVTLPTITLTGSTGVDYARIYRRGGTLTTWNYLADVAYTGTTTTYSDNLSDATVGAADLLDENSTQPFTCTNSSGVDVPGVALPYAADPYLGYIIATGDPNNPGFVYWTNKFDPDRQDPDNRVEVTSPQDPVQNVFIYNGRPFVFSKAALYELFIGLNEDVTFTPSKTNCNRGLYTPLAFCVGPEIYFLGNDGLYATSGGVERTLTDDELRPLFQGTASVGGLSPIDWAETSQMRMAFFKNELWFQYKAVDTFTYYVILDVRYNRWRAAKFRTGTISTYADEETTSRLWMGSADGWVLEYSGVADAAGSPTTIPVQVTTGTMAFGMPLINKTFNHIVFDVNPLSTTLTFTATMNSLLGTTVTKSTTSAGAARLKVYLDLTSTDANDIELGIAWASSSVAPIIYGYEIFYAKEEPEITFWHASSVDHGIHGWQIVRAAYMTLIANGTVTLTVEAVKDAGTMTTATYTLTPNSTQPAKLFIPFDPTKGKLFNYHLSLGTATSFRFYPEQSTVQVKPWITAFGYANANPFTTGASAFEGGQGSDGGMGAPSANQQGGQAGGGGGGGGLGTLGSISMTGASGMDLVPPSAPPEIGAPNAGDAWGGPGSGPDYSNPSDPVNLT
jgi:hypothetical protein